MARDGRMVEAWWGYCGEKKDKGKGGGGGVGVQHHHQQGALVFSWCSAPQCSLVAIGAFSEIPVNNTHSPSARDLGPSMQSPWSSTALSSVRSRKNKAGGKKQKGGDSGTHILWSSPLQSKSAESKGELESGRGDWAPMRKRIIKVRKKVGRRICRTLTNYNYDLHVLPFNDVKFIIRNSGQVLPREMLL